MSTDSPDPTGARPPALKRGYRATVRALGPAFRRAGGGATHHDSRLRHWVSSLGAVYDAEQLAALNVPWWSYGAVDAIEGWFDRRSEPVRAFEYGSGSSTLWLAQRCDEVHSVENDAPFAEVSTAMCADADNVTIHVVEPVASAHPVAASGRAGFESFDFSEYVSTIQRVGGTFDLIIVDGRARSACLLAAIPYLNEGGVVVFDNSRRSRYRQAIETCGLTERRFFGLTPTLPYPDQTSVLTHPGTRW